MPQRPLQYDLRSLLLLATAFTLLCAAVTLLPQAMTQLLLGAAWIGAFELFARPFFWAKTRHGVYGGLARPELEDEHSPP